MITTVVLPLVGLAIDGSVGYWLKAKLSSAVDAAALAAGRSLSVGLTLQAQINSATQTAQTYFAANFPTGLMGTALVGGQPNVAIAQTGTHTRTVTVSATVTAPLYFMPILGIRTATLAATGQATRRDANVMLVLDRSNSMNVTSSCAPMVASAQSFVNQFVDGRDQVGLITFQTGANVDYAPTIHFKSNSPSLNSVLNTLQCTGDTSSAQALSMAYTEIKNVINQPGALNVVLFFTDGQPNGLVATFPIKTQADIRYDPGVNQPPPMLYNTNPANLIPEPVSGCNIHDNLTGVIADGSQETGLPLNATGYTAAVLSAAGVPISSTASPTTINAPGCMFPNSNWQYSIYGRVDVAYIPTTDAYGNSVVDGNYKPLDLFPSGNPYVGQIRPDMPRTARYASENAADSAAMTIRSDSTYGTIIYSIGLGGNEAMPIDTDFLERVANDPRASNFDSTKPVGLFIYASNKSELSSAFQQIASQILRLSQ
ncbi:MAG: VWA domain-containing protein [Acidobacteriaceae bacterium]|nr:VWA domain-containing protein [Acidobacteriaceae bacterium]MBV9778778.1 VWA domain-containing protein [Acidobacteriaceae bacterium]